MSSVERGLLSAVLEFGDFKPVMDARIGEESFVDEEHLEVFRFIHEHWSAYSKIPGRDALRRNWPTWKPARIDEPLDYYVDQMIDEQRQRILADALIRVGDLMTSGDMPGAVKAMAAANQEIHTRVSPLRNNYLNAEWDDRIDRYIDWTNNPGKLRGYSTGFDTIDRATRGIQHEQYIVIIGAQKSGKSTILMKLAINLNQESNLRVLLVNFEMSPEEQQARHDALTAGVSYGRLLEGYMTKRDQKRLERAAEDAVGAAELILCNDVSAMTTVSAIRAQVEQEKPHIVLIDGAYLMEDERGERPGTPAAMTNISRDIKRMAQSTRLPVIITTQALESKMTKRTGITAFSAGYSSAWGQDCDVMLGVQQLPDEGPTISELKVLLSRAGPLATTKLDIDWHAGKITEIASFDDDATEDDGEQSAY